MANLGDLSVNIGIEVSEETVRRCCQLLQMYLENHPDRIVECQWSKDYGEGELPSVWIGERRVKDVDKA